MKRLIACTLVSALIFVSPGPRCYAAVGAAMAGSSAGPAASGAGAAGAVGSASLRIEEVGPRLSVSPLRGTSLVGVSLPDVSAAAAPSAAPASHAAALSAGRAAPVSALRTRPARRAVPSGAAAASPRTPARAISSPAVRESASRGAGSRSGISPFGVSRTPSSRRTIKSGLKSINAAAAPLVRTVRDVASPLSAVHRAGVRLESLLQGRSRPDSAAAPSTPGIHSPRAGRTSGVRGLAPAAASAAKPSEGLVERLSNGGLRARPEDSRKAEASASQSPRKKASSAIALAAKKLKRTFWVPVLAIALAFSIALGALSGGVRDLDRSGGPAPQRPVAEAQERTGADVVPGAVSRSGPVRVVQAADGTLVVVDERAAEERAASRVTVTAEVENQNVTVGTRMTLKITVRNGSDRTMTLPSVRSAIERALPMELELRGESDADPLELAPGETRIIVLEVVPFDSGEIKIEGAKLILPSASGKGITIEIPASVFKVRSVLTSDWKQKGFRDIAGIERGEKANLLWLLSIPLGLLLLVGIERVLAARRMGRKPERFSEPLIESTRARIAALAEDSETSSAEEFYGEAFDVLGTFLVDLHGLSVRERGAAELIRDLKASKKYTSGQLSLAEKIARSVEDARFDGLEDTAELRRRTLVGLSALLEDITEPEASKEEGNAPVAGFLALLAGSGATLSFANPWILFGIIPLAGYLIWRLWKSKSESFTVSSAGSAPKKKSFRQRLRWMPSALRIGAIMLLLLGLANPQIGVKRESTYVPSTDTVMSIDLSGSMDTKFGADNTSQLEAARQSVKAYVIEQRRGTSNRIGMVTFADDPYLDMRLTNDYDALIAHLKELKTAGSTAVGKSMLAAITHFLEVNAYELGAEDDPRVQKLQEILDKEGLAEVLTYAKKYPDLMKKVVQPERTKIVVLFSDGGSNTGIDPVEAAQIARNLGIRIYTVGINTSGGDETKLKTVSETTGGLYFRVGDADGMRAALLDISRLEKSPSLVRSQIVVKDYQMHFILLALLALGLEALLASTKLRRLPAIALILSLALPGLPGEGPPVPGQERKPAIVMVEQAGNRALPDWVFAAGPAPVPDSADQIVSQQKIYERLPITEMPRTMKEGNALYLQGRFDEAVKKYAEALGENPDVIELYFNMGNAYLRLGDVERAVKSYQEYLRRVEDPVQASQAYYNMAMAALAQKDATRAIEFFRESLRRDPTNEDAKWNLEVLMKLLKEQQKDGQQGQGQQQKGQKGQKKKGQKGEQQGEQGEGEGDGDGESDGESDGKDGKKGDKKGKPKGRPNGKPTEGEQKQGVDGLIEKQGEIEKEGKDAQRQSVPKTGKGVWGMAPLLPLAAAGLGESALTFTNPALLWGLLALVPIVGGLLAYRIIKRIRAAKKLSPLDAPKDFRSWFGAKRYLFKSAITLLALAMLAMAAGGPIFGKADTRLNFGGKDIIVSVDGSHSMVYAEDGRHERTKEELQSFIERLQGSDRVGLVVFAGSARTAAPLSIDYGNFEFKVRRLERESRGLSDGSDLVESIKHSARSFKTAKKIGDRERILIVISDGDIFDQELQEAIETAKKNNITIYAIGVGTPGGTKIAVPNAEGDGTTYLVDENTGDAAVTRLNETTLRTLAESTGGSYFRSQTDTSIGSIFRRVAEMQKGEKTDMIKTPRSVAQVFLWPSLALILLELLIPNLPLLSRKNRKKRAAPAEKGKAAAGPDPKKKPVSMGGYALMGIGLGMIPMSAWPQILPFAALITVALGLVLFDLLSRGAVSRRIMAWASRHEPAEGLARDLEVLFDTPEKGRDRFREHDQRELRAFLDDYKNGKPDRREGLIREASKDELWRQKLYAAYLAEHVHPSREALELEDSILAALGNAERRTLVQQDPVLRRLIARRAELAWLNHPKTLRPLSKLAEQGLRPEKPESRRVLEGLASEPDALVRFTAAQTLGSEWAKNRKRARLQVAPARDQGGRPSAGRLDGPHLDLGDQDRRVRPHPDRGRPDPAHDLLRRGPLHLLGHVHRPEHSQAGPARAKEVAPERKAERRGAGPGHRDPPVLSGPQGRQRARGHVQAGRPPPSLAGDRGPDAQDAHGAGQRGHLGLPQALHDRAGPGPGRDPAPPADDQDRRRDRHRERVPQRVLFPAEPERAGAQRGGAGDPQLAEQPRPRGALPLPPGEGLGQARAGTRAPALDRDIRARPPRFAQGRRPRDVESRRAARQGHRHRLDVRPSAREGHGPDQAGRGEQAPTHSDRAGDRHHAAGAGAEHDAERRRGPRRAGDRGPAPAPQADHQAP